VYKLIKRSIGSSEVELDVKHRLHRNAKTHLSVCVETLHVMPLKIEISLSSEIIRKAIFKEIDSWTICGGTSCDGDFQHNSDQLMCVACRSWFHRPCSKVAKLKECSYFVCQVCYDLRTISQ
jgi:hypothetical protein